jgi:hypothetical protein
MRLTIRNIPKRIDQALRKKAKDESKSLDEVILEVLQYGLGLANKPAKKRDLSDIAGTWIEDPEFDRIMKEQDQIDPEMWK